MQGYSGVVGSGVSCATAVTPRLRLVTPERTLASVPSIEEVVMEEEMENVETRELSDSNFTFENQRVFLTYKTHIDKEGLARFFNIVAGNSKTCKEVIIAHERASSKTNYAHTHAFVDFGFAKKSKNSRMFDYDGIHPHILVVKSKNLDGIYRYISKEDPQLEALRKKVGKPSVSSRVWGAESLHAALKDIKKVTDVPGTIALWGYKQREVEEMDPKVHMTYMWQRQLWYELETSVWDYRSIYWVYDPIGATGKSHFCRCFKVNHLMDTLSLTSLGSHSDCATIIDNGIRQGWTQRYLFIDLPRAAMDHKIYQPLEAILNGTMNTTKYEGRESIFRAPKVVVFANWLPDVRQLSADRWRITAIMEDMSLAEYPNPARLARLQREHATRSNSRIDWNQPPPSIARASVNVMDFVTQERRAYDMSLSDMIHGI